MQRNGSRCILAALIAILLGAAPDVYAADVIVKVVPIPDATISEFDPADPPKNPPLKKGEDADTQMSVGVNAPVGPSFVVGAKKNPDNSFTVTLKVTSETNVEVTGTDEIRIPAPTDPPTPAEKQLLEHEQGHATLDRNSFARDAQKKTEEAFKGLNGMTFTGSGATVEEAQAAAEKALNDDVQKRLDATRAAIIRQAQVLSDKYDDLTNHGLNNKGKINSTAQGVEAALKARDQAPPAGSAPSAPDPVKPHSSTAPDPATLSYDARFEALLFDGDLLLQFGGDPLDSILRRGLVSVDPMLLIGLADNGSYHLTDTELRITDVVTGLELLKGYIFEPAYSGSSLSGFAGMIQGHLDLGDVNNFIESTLLADPGNGFWFYLNDPLFDVNGNILIGCGDSIDGSLKIGTTTTPISEPSSALLLILPLALIVAFQRKTAPAARHRAAEKLKTMT